LALVIDRLVFRPLRARRAAALTMVFASFGTALVVRSLILLFWGPDAQYYSRELQFAVEVMPDVRLMPDQIFVLVLTILSVMALHLAIKRTRFGMALRAMAESPELARISGIETQSMLRRTWLIAGALAASAGVFSGLTVQLRPEMGFNLLLALFTAAILGGHGSLWGAVVGGLAIGLAENLSVLVIPSSYKPAVPFLLLILVLFFRPQGLFAPARTPGR
jgi:branched-chain amino acid transport system permease protein